MKHNLERWIGTAGLLLVIANAPRAAGQVALSPVAVVGTDLGSASPLAPLENMINQSGLAKQFDSGLTPFNEYFANPGQTFASNGDQGTNNWQSAVSFSLPLKGYVDFDLGQVYRIDKVAIWNQSIKDLTVKVLKDLSGPEQVAGSFKLINHLSFVFSYAVDVLGLSQAYEGRYVRLSIDSVHTFSPTDTFGYATIGEVVASAAPVSTTGDPPPISAILMANGDVKLTFVGTLQSRSAIEAGFVDVAGNPQGSHTIPRSALSSQQFFRAKSN